MAFNGTTASTVVTTHDTTVFVDLDYYTNNVSTSNVSTSNVINPTLYDRWMLPL
jgi:hypothetical protein